MFDYEFFGVGVVILVMILISFFRQKLHEDQKDLTFGETWLFYGCRHQDKDYLFQ